MNRPNASVSTHSRAEAAALSMLDPQSTQAFQHTAARRRLHKPAQLTDLFTVVSTHSRAEAAATLQDQILKIDNSFNTQPRGGGCMDYKAFLHPLVVSTHSRAEAAAGRIFLVGRTYGKVSTHSRAEAAAFFNVKIKQHSTVSTHSRAEAAARIFLVGRTYGKVSTHSRAEAAAPYLKKQEKSAD